MTVSTGRDKHQARGARRRIDRWEVRGEEMVNAVLPGGEQGRGGVLGVTLFSVSRVLMKACLVNKHFWV